MKKLLSVLLIALTLIAVCAMPSFACRKVITIRNVNDCYNYIRTSKNLIDIDKVNLYTDGKKTKAYLVSLGGSNMSWDKKYINCMQTCIKSGFSSGNVYLDEVKKQVVKKIPKGANIVMMGHSLGGMISQQFAADKEMKERYNIIHILTMGSPYIVLKDREGTINRMADSGDAVPYFSDALLGNFFAGNFTYEDCGYFGDPDLAHNVSYGEAREWAEYDAFGVKDGNTRIVIY